MPRAIAGPSMAPSTTLERLAGSLRNVKTDITSKTVNIATSASYGLRLTTSPEARPLNLYPSTTNPNTKPAIDSKRYSHWALPATDWKLVFIIPMLFAAKTNDVALTRMNGIKKDNDMAAQ